MARKKKFNPYAGADCTQELRVNKSAEFILDNCSIGEIIPELILDIGEKNITALSIRRKLLDNNRQVGVIFTKGDLDFAIETDSYYELPFKYITCFEVIEHLANPLLLLTNIYKRSTPDAYLFLSYPSRGLLQTDNHFYEYPRHKFEYMLLKSGWQIHSERKIAIRIPPGIGKNKGGLGVRPILRYFFDYTHIYLIRKINDT